MWNRRYNPYDYYLPPRRRGFGRRQHHQCRPDRSGTRVGLIVAAIVAVLLALAGQTNSGREPAKPLPPAAELYLSGPLDTTPDHFQDNGAADIVPSEQQSGQEINPGIEAAEAERLAEIWATPTPGHFSR